MAIVERIGPRGIRGWVAHDEAAGNVVVIRVNGLEIASTTASRPMQFNGQLRNFAFSRALTGLWEFLGPKDELSVEHNGSRIPIVGRGFMYSPVEQGEKTFADLETRVAQGWIFDKRGRLTKPFEDSRKVRLFRGMFHEVENLVHDRLGLTLFPIYGTLLGCIREGGFIAHDNDIDLTYISKWDDPEGVKREYLALAELLIEQGYQGLIEPYGFGIKRPVLLDIYPSWVKDGKWNITWGYHGEQVEWTEPMAELVERPMGAFTLKVPVGAEALLSQLYGDNWRVPDPGFSHYTDERKQDTDYLASPQQLRPLFWKQYYKNHVLADGSTFSLFVADRIDSDAFIIDVGCGSGRDTTYFASRGHDAVGVDASPEGVQQGKDRATPNCDFELLDVDDVAALDCFFSSERLRQIQGSGREIVVYLRFFLHAIPEETQRRLLDAIERHLPTVTLAAEFRTVADKAIPKFNMRHYRRFLDSGALVAELQERYGFSVDYFHEGTGLSVYEGEDPFLCRIVATRPPLAT